MHEIIHLVLFQNNKTVQIAAALPCTILTVDDVRLFGVAVARHEEKVEDLHLKPSA